MVTCNVPQNRIFGGIIVVCGRNHNRKSFFEIHPTFPTLYHTVYVSNYKA